MCFLFRVCSLAVNGKAVDNMVKVSIGGARRTSLFEGGSSPPVAPVGG